MKDTRNNPDLVDAMYSDFRRGGATDTFTRLSFPKGLTQEEIERLEMEYNDLSKTGPNAYNVRVKDEKSLGE